MVNEEQAVREQYSQAAGIFRIVPRAVACPTGVSELREVLAAARARSWSVTVRGAGTGMSGGNLGDGLVLDMSQFDADRVILEPDTQRATVSPSVTLGALQQAAAAIGLRFGPDPSSASRATLGGMISTNAAGARSYRLGATDAWVQSLTLETAAGPLALTRGVPPDPLHPVVRRWRDHAAPRLVQLRDAVLARWPHTRKNAAGYGLDRYFRTGDVLDLVIGSEGTLGVVTEATVRLEPLPACRVALRITLRSRNELGSVIELLATHAPTTIELLDASLLHLIPQVGPAVPAAILLVDLEDLESSALRRRTASLVAALSVQAIEVVVADDEATIGELWSMRHAASPTLAALGASRFSLQVIEDGCVPVSRLSEYLDAVDHATARAELEAVMFGHAGDGHVHVNLLPDVSQPGWLDRVRQVFDEVSDAQHRLGGTPSGEHGAGRLRAGLLARHLGDAALDCFGAIKAAFDPEGRFNPGVILSDGGDPLARLKVG